MASDLDGTFANLRLQPAAVSENTFGNLEFVPVYDQICIQNAVMFLSYLTTYRYAPIRVIFQKGSRRVSVALQKESSQWSR